MEHSEKATLESTTLGTALQCHVELEHLCTRPCVRLPVSKVRRTYFYFSMHVPSALLIKRL